jgi:hypothetical protein
MNVQVACTIYGKLARISHPVNGSRHDNYRLGESEVLRTFDPKNWMGDKGYIGNGMTTPWWKPSQSANPAHAECPLRRTSDCPPRLPKPDPNPHVTQRLHGRAGVRV